MHGIRKVGQQRFFLVKWAGWPLKYNLYEPEEHMANAQGAIRAFEKKRKNSDKTDDQKTVRKRRKYR